MMEGTGGNKGERPAFWTGAGNAKKRAGPKEIVSMCEHTHGSGSGRKNLVIP